jgi:hypothetical protein
MTSESSNQHHLSNPSAINVINPSSFAYYYPMETSMHQNAILLDPFMGSQVPVGQSSEYSYLQSYAQQAVIHQDVAASFAYTVPQYPVYNDPYAMPGMNGQLYPAMQGFSRPALMETTALVPASSCSIADARNYKKVQCRHFAAGMCVRGATCGFKHGENDNGDSLREMVLPRMVPVMSHMNAGKPFRVVPCQHWLAGNCRKGAFCTFRHEIPAVNHTVTSAQQKHNLPYQLSSANGPSARHLEGNTDRMDGNH